MLSLGKTGVCLGVHGQAYLCVCMCETNAQEKHPLIYHAFHKMLSTTPVIIVRDNIINRLTS